ncbi:hypothetical protein ABT160_39975 [Streptomyces sp. NPDC001941]|uniref:hypothetical protein n=1 Tax=Streptomyces sp. NPDC001941 TaxID=3154659 RepID=UPI003326C536
MADEATHCWVMVLDIEDFSSRTDPVQRSLRTAMYDVLREALERAGLAGERIDVEDRGDGVLMIVPGTVPPVDLAGKFVRALDDELRQKAVVFSAEHAMRFRVALHQGLASRDGRGWSGDAVNTACRLVDAPPLRQVLVAADGARMVFVVSAEIHRAVVRHGHRAVDPAAYLPMPFTTKHGETIDSWVTVPGYPAPPGLGPAAGPRAAGPGPGGAAPAPTGAAAPPPGRGGLSIGTVQNGNVVGNVEGDFVAGDKVTGDKYGPGARRTGDEGRVRP